MIAGYKLAAAVPEVTITATGFLVDFAVVLTGPDREDPLLDDEIELDKSFEIHARVKWI